MTVPAYCTDADIAVKAYGDFRLLCPPHQQIASGTDGVFAAGNRWTLTSASADFFTQGALPGQVVVLRGEGFDKSYDMLRVVSALAGSLTLARLTAGVGQPPGAAAGETGVSFAVLTLQPQIDMASYEVNQRFGIGGVRAPVAALVDPLELRNAVTNLVLRDQYMTIARAATESADSFLVKSRSYGMQYDDVCNRISITLNPVNGGPSSVRLATGKLVR